MAGSPGYSDRQLDWSFINFAENAGALSLLPNAAAIVAGTGRAALASESAQTVIGIIRELNAGGLTVVLVTHNSELASAAQRIVKLGDGKILS